MNNEPSRRSGKENAIKTYTESRVLSPWNLLLLTGLVVLFLWSYRGSEIHLTQLFSRDAGGQILLYLRDLFPPDLSRKVLADAASGAVETFAISFLGTLISVGIALLFVFFASRNLVYSGLLYEMEAMSRWRRVSRMLPYLCARGVLNFLRTVPELAWALIFVFIVGLGPFPGVLALGVHV